MKSVARGNGRRSSHSFLEKLIAALLAVFEEEASADALARADGWLQKIDPRVKIIGFLLLIIAAVAAHFFAVIAAIFSVALALAAFSRIPLRFLATRVWIGLFLFTGAIVLPAIFLAPGNSIATLPLLHWRISAPGLRSAAFVIARAETAATLALLLVVTTPWPHLLKALRVLRVPVVVVTLLGMTHRYVFLLLRTASDFFEARRSRLLARMSGPARRQLTTASAGVLLEKSLALSGDVFAAMQSRGFSGEAFLLDDFSLRASDWLTLAGFVIIAGGALWLGR